MLTRVRKSTILWDRTTKSPDMDPLLKRLNPAFTWEKVHKVVEPQIRQDGTHIWPFDPTFPLDLRSFTFNKSRKARLTRHDYFELLYVYSGEAAYQEESHTFRVSRNDLVILNGALRHGLKKVLRDPFRIVVLYFQPDIFRANENTGEDIQYLMPFLLQESGIPNLVPSTAKLHLEILDLMIKIQKELPADSDRARLAARTYLQMILLLLINFFRKNGDVTAAFERREQALRRLKPLFDFVQFHYHEPIPLSRATAIVGMSKAHLMRSFKKFTGQSFDSYLNRFRIRRAQVLLASSEKPILTISREVGFCDQSYFGLVFRRLVSVTPREYRRRLSAL
jgi:AraC-like DNA-binding protein/quercetin dioxygenase-like cupin family protein